MKTTAFLLSVLSTIVGTSTSSASVVVTYAEQPGAVNSSLSGTNVFDFNSLALGKDSNVSWKGVGSFDQLYVLKPDQYGGAADATHPWGTQYSVEGVGTGVNATTLKLNTASSYFGMYWSAGDATNVLDFYKGGSLVSEFTTSSLMKLLPTAYNGNPINRGMDSSEPFAFINFFGDQKTAWDSIVLHNSGGSGFEADNFTSRSSAWNPLKDGALPGVPVAEVSGKSTTLVTAKSLANTRWAQTSSALKAAPGAPVPPLPLLLAFGAAVVIRRGKSRNVAV